MPSRTPTLELPAAHERDEWESDELLLVSNVRTSPTRANIPFLSASAHPPARKGARPNSPATHALQGEHAGGAHLGVRGAEVGAGGAWRPPNDVASNSDGDAHLPSSAAVPAMPTGEHAPDECVAAAALVGRARPATSRLASSFLCVHIDSVEPLDLAFVKSMLARLADPSMAVGDDGHAVSALHAAVLRAHTGRCGGKAGRRSYAVGCVPEPDESRRDEGVQLLECVLRAPGGYALGTPDVAEGSNPTSLGLACMLGSEYAARLLLEARADPERRFGSGAWTPLQTAAEHGRLCIVRLLVAEGACVNTVDMRGTSALHRAASSDANACVQELGDFGNDAALVQPRACEQLHASSERACALDGARDAGAAAGAATRALAGACARVCDAAGASPSCASPESARSPADGGRGASGTRKRPLDSPVLAERARDVARSSSMSAGRSGCVSSEADDDSQACSRPPPTPPPRPPGARSGRTRAEWSSATGRWHSFVLPTARTPLASAGFYESEQDAAEAARWLADVLDCELSGTTDVLGCELSGTTDVLGCELSGSTDVLGCELSGSMDVLDCERCPLHPPAHLPPRALRADVPSRSAGSLAPPTAAELARLRDMWHYARPSTLESGGESGGENDRFVCAVCFDPNWDEENALVVCGGCDVAVHQLCYHIPHVPDDEWLCAPCVDTPSRTRASAIASRSCRLCPQPGGALWRVSGEDGGGYVHVACNDSAPGFGQPARDGSAEEVARLAHREVAGMHACEPSVCAVCADPMGAVVPCGFCDAIARTRAGRAPRRAVVHVGCAIVHGLRWTSKPRGRDGGHVEWVFGCPAHQDRGVAHLVDAALDGDTTRVVDLLRNGVPPDAVPASAPTSHAGAFSALRACAANPRAARSSLECLEMLMHAMEAAHAPTRSATRVHWLRAHEAEARERGLPSALEAAAAAGRADALLLLLTRCVPAPSVELLRACSAALKRARDDAHTAQLSGLHACERVLRAWVHSRRVRALDAGSELAPLLTDVPYRPLQIADMSGGRERYPVPLVLGSDGAHGTDTDLFRSSLAELAYVLRPFVSHTKPDSFGWPTCSARDAMAKASFVPGVPLGARLRVAPTNGRGLGVFADERIGEGTIVCTYAGVLVTAEEANAMGDNVYLMDVKTAWTIDARHFRNVGGFINFGCEPNVKLKWLSEGANWQLTSRNCIPWPVFEASRTIERDEELCYIRDAATFGRPSARAARSMPRSSRVSLAATSLAAGECRCGAARCHGTY